MESKNLTVQEAAELLQVRRERVWKLLRDGVLTARPSKLDGRQKLIAREQVEALLLEEASSSTRTPAATTAGDMGVAECLETSMATARVWPRSIGMIEDGSVPSNESEQYLWRHLEDNPVASR